jgi:hypothetical protein
VAPAPTARTLAAMHPWSDPRVEALARLLLRSHRRLTGAALLPGVESDAPDASHALYEAPLVALAHDGAADPRFTYANRAAQALWELEWSQFVGMPSRLSAEPERREERQRLLERATRDGFVSDYSGVRIAASGKRFRIDRATVWNLIGEHGQRLGQAAAFSCWVTL